MGVLGRQSEQTLLGKWIGLFGHGAHGHSALFTKFVSHCGPNATNKKYLLIVGSSDGLREGQKRLFTAPVPRPHVLDECFGDRGWQFKLFAHALTFTGPGGSAFVPLTNVNRDRA